MNKALRLTDRELKVLEQTIDSAVLSIHTQRSHMNAEQLEQVHSQSADYVLSITGGGETQSPEMTEVPEKPVKGKKKAEIHEG